MDVEVTCTTGMYKRTVAVDQKIEIARIAIINLSHEAVAYLNQCRLNFYNASIKIGYSDIYNDKFDRYQKDLDWLCKA